MFPWQKLQSPSWEYPKGVRQTISPVAGKSTHFSTWRALSEITRSRNRPSAPRHSFRRGRQFSTTRPGSARIGRHENCGFTPPSSSLPGASRPPGGADHCRSKPLGAPSQAARLRNESKILADLHRMEAGANEPETLVIAAVASFLIQLFRISAFLFPLPQHDRKQNVKRQRPLRPSTPAAY